MRVFLASLLYLATPASAQTLVVTVSSGIFDFTIGSSTPTQTMTISTTGGPRTFSISFTGAAFTGNLQWIVASPASGTASMAAPVTVTLRANPQFLSPRGYPYYGGTVIVTPQSGSLCQFSGATAATCDVGVGLGVQGNATLTAVPTSLAFTYAQGDPAPAAKNVGLATLGVSSWGLRYYTNISTNSGGSWLNASPGTGNSPTSLNVSIGPGSLGMGIYNGVIELSDTVGPFVPPNLIAVTMTIQAGLTVSANSLSFTYRLGDPAPPAQPLTIGSTGPPLGFATSPNSPWITVSPSSGTTPSTPMVSVNPAGQAIGTQVGSVQITSGASTKTVTVVLNVLAPPLTATPSALNFQYVVRGPQPLPRTIAIGSPVGGVPFAVAASGANWLSVSSATGTAPGSVEVIVDATNLAVGNYNATVLINVGGSTSISIPVALQVVAPALTVNPSVVSVRFRQGESPPASQIIAVTSDQPGATFNVSAPSLRWLTVSPTSGTTPANVTVGFSPVGLDAGQYAATIAFVRTGSTTGTAQVQVSFTVGTASSLLATPSALVFSGNPGGALPPQNLALAGFGQDVAFTATAASEGGWLSVTPAAGTTPVSVSARANLAGLGGGGYLGTITFTTAGSPPLVVNVILRVGVIPEVSDGGAVNAAGFGGGPFAPGSLLTLYGRNFTAATLLNSTLPVPTTLAGLAATAGGIAARPFYTSPTQVNLQLPFGVPVGRQTLLVTVNGVRSLPVAIEIAAAGPALFLFPDGRRAIAQNQDFSLNGPENPVPRGGVLIAYLNGQGELDIPLADGAPAPSSPLAVPKLPVRATIGGREVRVRFAGMTPGLVGLMQANLEIEDAPAGEQPLVITIGDVASNVGFVYIGRE